MADDLTFGVAIKGTGDGSVVTDARAARDEIVSLKKATDDLAASSTSMASSYSASAEKLARQNKAMNQTWLDGNAAADAAADKAWALANGYQEVDGVLKKVGAESSGVMKSLGLNTQYARTEMAQLGKEVMTGEFGRIPHTFGALAVHSKILPALMSPIGLSIAAITAAAAAGAYAWYHWGDAAEESLKKTQEWAKAAEKDASAAVSGVTKTEAEKLSSLQGQIDGAQGQLDAALKRRAGITAATGHEEARAIGQEVIARREQLIALNRQVDQVQESLSKKTAKAEGGGDLEKLLEQTRRFDDQMVASHDDAFTKTINGWVALQDKMIAAGAYGAKERKAHEAAYTDFVNDETAKREAVADEHTAKLVAKQNEKFAALQQRADAAGMTEAQRNDAKYQRELADLDRDRATMAADHELTLAEIEAFELAKLNITIANQRQQMRNEASVANFSKLLRQGDYQDAMSMAQQMTAGLATHSRAAFEVNKAASLAKATVSGYQMIQAAAADGASWGGYWGAIGEGLLAAAYVAANISAINSTEFGGGGSISVPSGGDVPSLTTTPGTPVNDATSSQQVVQVTIYNTGNVQSAEFADQMVEQIRDQISNSDVILIDPRSRQAAMLATAK